MGRVRSAQASFAFGISGSGAARLPIELGETCGNGKQACDDGIPVGKGGSTTLSVTENCLGRAVTERTCTS
jgi:hypothetical protein